MTLGVILTHFTTMK